MPPAPFRFQVPGQSLGIIFTNFGLPVSTEDARGLLKELMEEYHKRTGDDPRRERIKIHEVRRWSVGAVIFILVPRILSVPVMEWRDVLSLINVLTAWQRQYGWIEADLEVIDIIPTPRGRQDIHIARARLKLE